MFADEIRAGNSVRAFERLPVEQRLVVFYAETKEDWGDLSPLVSRLTLAQNRSIAYLTSDPEDPILGRKLENLYVFYIGRGRTRRNLFRKIEANLIVVSQPLVGSQIPKSTAMSVHYALILATLQSVTTTLARSDLEPYKTVFCSGPHQAAEVKEVMPSGTQVLQLGNGRLDAILERRRRVPEEVLSFRTPSVLIAPQESTFFKAAGYTIIRHLLQEQLKVMVHLRPGMVGRRRIQKKLERKFGCQANFSMNTTLPSFSLIFMSQTVITDWSDVALQYALGLERKVVFVDLPRADGRAAGSSHRRPLEMALRNRLGLLVRPDQLSSIGRICRVLFDCGKDDTLAELREQVVFNSNVSGAVGSAALEALTLRHDPQAALERAIRELQNEGQGGENPRGLRVIRQR